MSLSCTSYEKYHLLISIEFLLCGFYLWIVWWRFYSIKHFVFLLERPDKIVCSLNIKLNFKWMEYWWEFNLPSFFSTRMTNIKTTKTHKGYNFYLTLAENLKIYKKRFFHINNNNNAKCIENAWFLLWL